MSTRDYNRVRSRTCSTTTPLHCQQLRLETPILTNRELAQIQARCNAASCAPRRCRSLFPVADGGGDGLRRGARRACAREADASGRRRRHDPGAFGPRRRRDAGADSEPAGHRRGAPPPDPRGQADRVRHRRRDRRAARGDALLPACSATAPARSIRISPTRRLSDMVDDGRIKDVDKDEGDRELHQGGQQGHAQGRVEDGHLDAAELPRRADLRGHRPQVAR